MIASKPLGEVPDSAFRVRLGMLMYGQLVVY
jgi:hypothetical protein